MKWTFIFLTLLCSVYEKTFAEVKGDCDNCADNIFFGFGAPDEDIDAISKFNRAPAEKINFSVSDQSNICETFLDRGFKALKETFASYGTNIEDGYEHIKCEDGRQDLLKYRQMNYSGRSDIAAFILYYKRDLKREHELPAIFNAVVPGPRIPHGTLLDFIQYYHDMDDLNSYGKSEYEKIIVMLRKYGAKKESEL